MGCAQSTAGSEAAGQHHPSAVTPRTSSGSRVPVTDGKKDAQLVANSILSGDRGPGAAQTSKGSAFRETHTVSLAKRNGETCVVSTPFP